MTYAWFDIETRANPDAVALLGPVKPAGNLKDPAKIAADVLDKEAKRAERAALDCDTLAVLCAGIVWTGEETPTVFSGDERKLIADFWETVDYHANEFGAVTLIGFNCLSFDLPALVRRSQILGIRVPPLNLAKYRHDGIIDLMDALTWGGLVDAKSLATYCRLFGVNGIEDDHNGSDVARLYAEGRMDEIVAHCAADVLKTRALDERVFGLRGATR